jgi:hypothetical protein
VKVSPQPATILIVLAGVLVTGCGSGAGSGFTKAGPAAPRDCVRRYNGDPVALSLGTHAYGQGHESRAAHVFKITDTENGLDQSCAVIYYTTQFRTTPAKRAEVQALGADQANVSLEPDGSLKPFP